MKPYYDDGNGIVIYHGDCREVLPVVTADVLVTDPPYGLGNRWSGGGSWQHHTGIYAEARAWDQAPPEKELIHSMVSQCADAVVWGGHLFGLPERRCWLAWVKVQRMDTVADFELAWTSLDRPSKLYEDIRNPDGRRQHPTQKPVGLMQWCMSFLGPGAVLDPFMGSGTTLVAAKNLGRKAIGIEIEERYCEIAAERLSQGVLDLGGAA